VNTDVLERMDTLVSQAGTSNSYELANYLNAHIGDITSPKLLAFVVRRSGIVCIGLNPHLPDHIKEVILMHEVAHVAFHLDFFDNQVFFHGENSFQSLKSQTIAIQEYEANLVAADFCLDTDDILDKLGLNNNMFKEYHRHLAKFKRYQADYETFVANTIFATSSEWARKRMLHWQRNLRHWHEELENMKYDLSYSGTFMTIDEISREYEIPTAIVEYKLEALRLRGYDIDELVLAGYNRVFK